MHKAWKSENAAEIFLNKLRRQRAIEFMRNASYLKGLRNDFERARQDQKFFGKIWEEYGTNVYKLIAKACGETWDAEDDEKTGLGRFAEKKTAPLQQRETIENDNVAPTCKGGSLEGIYELQRKPQESIGLLEEKGKGCRAEGPERQESR